jgi:rhodanese-related sulfurtransferase
MAFEKVITEVQAKQKAAAGIQVVDLRDPISFRDGAIANSVNLNLRQISMFSSHPKAFQSYWLGILLIRRH